MEQRIDTGVRRRLLFVIPRAGLSENTIERIRSRNVRARLQNLWSFFSSLKMLFFLLLLTGLTYAAIVQLKYLFFETSYFEIKKIEVSGLKTLNRETIVNSAGVSIAMNLLNIDREAIRNNLIKLPAIKDVRVDLSGLYTLKITVTERVPVLYLKTHDSFFEVSDDGIILASSNGAGNDLPIVTGINIDSCKPGDNISSNDSFVEAKSWITKLDSKIQKRISELNMSSIQNPYFFLTSGERVIPKSLEDFSFRFDFLCSLLDNLRKNNVEPDVVDMRAQSEIVVKPKRSVKTPEGSKSRSAG
ncbi:MAG: FtsQ-type POTRA domain-containing protein [Candidatus Riflebacteria bacterium]|nr:FtsQ-type POTRA domain-containing protein [Candidatus Riflebacteria bacterium]